jgi:hypothetical protein
MKVKHFVLRHKSSGKIASRLDQRSKALILEAQRLTDDSLGGGITSLLLPTSVEKKNEIVKIGKIYTSCLVSSRPGAKSGKSDRKALKAALANDHLIAKLVVLYAKYIGGKPAAQTISSKAFTGWFKKELNKTKSNVYQTVLTLAPVLLEVERNDRWWGIAFAKRRKTQS